MSRANILSVAVVDPDAEDRAETERLLAAIEGITVVTAASGLPDDSALSDADCIVTEYDLPNGTGLDLTGRVRETNPDVPVVLFTNADPSAIATDERSNAVLEYLPKEMPDAHEALARLIRNVVDHRSQVAYPLPKAEDERLAALRQYDLPGLDAVDAFDRIADLAKRYFEVNIAFVGLVDAHEERFVACQGADWETLTREDSICTHTILEDDVMVVENVADDDRFRNNDRLVELNIVSYAGATLRTPSGAAIGAFCLIHDEPRSYDEQEIADLQSFADEAMEQLELRRRLADADVPVPEEP